MVVEALSIYIAFTVLFKSFGSEICIFLLYIYIYIYIKSILLGLCDTEDWSNG